jgi:hypothetical protein
MKQGPPRNSAAANTLRVLVVVAIALSAVRIVTDAIQESAAGDAEGFKQTITFGAITGGLILLVWVAIALALVPGARRKRSLVSSYPDALVVNGRVNAELTQFLSGRVGPGRAPSDLKGIAFTLVADSSGLSFWGGFAGPKKIAEVEWSEIQSVQSGSMSLSPIRIVSTLRFTLENDAESVQFALGSESWLGAFPQNKIAVDQTVAALDDLRYRAVSNR